MIRIKTLEKTKRLLWIGVWTLTAIGIVMVIRRIGIIAGLGKYLISPRFPFDSALNKHPALTIVHIIPGLIFMILGPFLFMRRHSIQPSVIYTFISVSYIIGISALTIPFIVLPIGGLNEAVASSFFALLFLIATSLALRSMLNKKPDLFREWIMRSYAIGLAIATVRPIMALCFAFFAVRPEVFLGTAFWLGFSLHAIAAELWINYTRKA